MVSRQSNVGQKRLPTFRFCWAKRTNNEVLCCILNNWILYPSAVAHTLLECPVYQAANVKPVICLP